MGRDKIRTEDIDRELHGWSRERFEEHRKHALWWLRLIALAERLRRERERLPLVELVD